jgi:predicted methyltransferase
MRTLLDVIKSAEKDSVIKRYKVDDISIELKAKHFNDVLKMISDEPVLLPKKNNINCELYKINTSKVLIRITKSYTEMCSICDGIGEHYCNGCDEYHSCGNCNGTGIVYDDNDNELIFQDEINLNQGELF